MRVFWIAGLCTAIAAAGVAQSPGLKKSGGLTRAVTCPKLVQKPTPDKAVATPLSQLPPADVYAAVYYQDGCPRRLTQAQGKERR